MGSNPIGSGKFKLSKDPEFVDRLRAAVGLYVDPPAHAVVLSVDEKSPIQALDRTQPGLPMKKGRAGTMTHDYKRHGTTTLFAAMNVLDGTVIGRNMQRHRHQEFIRFVNAVEREVPAGKTIHAILDNYAAHKHPAVRQWLARHPRWTFHFTPTSEARQFACDCGRNHGGRISRPGELAIAPTQPFLRPPRDVPDRLGQAFLSQQLLSADARREPIAPGGLDQHSPRRAIPGFRDAALAPLECSDGAKPR